VFFAYGLILFAGLMAASMTIAMLGVAAGLGVGAMRGAMLGLALIMMPAVTCSFYYSYQDIFPPDHADSDADGNTDPDAHVLGMRDTKD
jgi:hypothetical protein